MNKVVIIALLLLLSYHFSDIDNQFKVMSGNIRIERSL
jgi:hypothetical protein